MLTLKREKGMAAFTGVFLLTLLFVSHRDLVRYALPIIPYTIISFKDSLVTKPAKISFFAILIPIFLFAISFISQNNMNISNWAPFL